MTRRKIKKIPRTTALAISIVSVIISLTLGIQANITANNSNEIAKQSVEVAKDNLLFEKEKRSQDYIEEIFSDLYQNKENLTTIEMLRNHEKVSDQLKIRQVVDSLEGAGNSFCQGTVWKYHINTTLKKTLEDICVNQQIFEIHGSEKNGLAMMCREFFVNSLFASTLKTENIATCDFYDSTMKLEIIEIQDAQPSRQKLILRRK